RWSPDGLHIAVERHRLGSPPDIVIVDAATNAVRAVASDAQARIVTPAWRPDGAAIVAAVAQPDATFNLYEFAIDGTRSRQITYTSGGATWPDVSADGTTLVFVGYGVDGYDVYSMPYPSSEPANRNAARAMQYSEAAPEAPPIGVTDLPTTGYPP